MLPWLYRYVFRGFGIVMAIGAITALILAINSQSRAPAKRPHPAVHGQIR